MAKNQKDISATLMQRYQETFSCPICTNSMQVVDYNRLVCTSNHSFDLARQGYVNLLTKPHQTKYSKQLFQSRRVIINSGFFEPLNEKISEIIIDKLPNSGKGIKILDTGSGEGTHLANILEKIKDQTTTEIVGAGIDISKEGIQIAAKEYPNIIWCVADLAKCPFGSKQFDYILNILSPSNAAEFNRLLVDDGLVIKVVPNSGYLRELRELLYHSTQQQAYSNQSTVELFNDSFETVATENVSYTVNLEPSLIDPLISMTPLTWGTTAEQLQQLKRANLTAITVDFTILVGKRKD